MLLFPIGPRNNDNQRLTHMALDRIADTNRVHAIITSQLQGTDRYCLQWAKANQVEVVGVHLNWDLRSKAERRREFEIYRDFPKAVPVVFAVSPTTTRTERNLEYIDKHEIRHFKVSFLGPTVRILDRNFGVDFDPVNGFGRPISNFK